MEASSTARKGIRLTKLERLRARVLPLLAAGLSVLLVMWIVLAPAEARLGNVVKLVYVHGALVWVGLATFSVAGALGLVALVARRPIWVRGSRAASAAALTVWVMAVISSMIVTGLTWGQVVAWNEPRVRATGLILVAAILLFVVTRVVDHPDFTAAVSLVMGLVPWLVVRQADVIRHPVDPIGGSESTAIQVFYVLMVLTVAGLVATLIAWLWLGAEQKSRS
jgi:hypothetical protein